MPLDLEGEDINRPALGVWVPVRDRFFARIVKEHTGFMLDGTPSRCWLWKNRTERADTFTVDGVKWRPYRWAYTEFVAPIPEGLTLDHLCEQPACCNPPHLEPVTIRENVLRMQASRKARKTLCSKGLHPWPESAVVYGSRGRSYCGPCRWDRDAAAKLDKGGSAGGGGASLRGDRHDGSAEVAEH